jgi:hypothetical protein
VKCAKCAKKLDPGSFNDRDGEIYCKSCHMMESGQSGYGAGGSSFAGHGNVMRGQGDAIGKKAEPAAAAAVATSSGGGGGGGKFCTSCGGETRGGKFCPNCGTKTGL